MLPFAPGLSRSGHPPTESHRPRPPSCPRPQLLYHPDRNRRLNSTAADVDPEAIHGLVRAEVEAEELFKLLGNLRDKVVAVGG